MTATHDRIQHAALGMPAVACAPVVLWGGVSSRRGMAINPGRIALKPINGSANVPFAAQP